MRTYCSLLLLIGILGGFPAGAWAQADPGVKFIPADATLAVVVYPQRLLSHELVKNLHELADDLDVDNPVDGFKEVFGVDAKDVDSVLVMAFPPDENGQPNGGFVIQTRRQISIDDILADEQAHGEFKQVKNPRSGVTYLNPSDPGMPIFYPVSETVWVVATQSLAGRIIAQGTSGQPGELAKVVQRQLTQAEIQAYFVMAPVKAEAEAMLSGLDLPGPFSNIKNLPRDLKEAELTIALSGQDTGVTLTLTGNDEDGAITLERLLNTGLAMLEPMLEEFLPPDLLAGITGNGDPADAENGIAALLAELKPKRTQSVVKVTTVGSEVLTPEFFAELDPLLVMRAMTGDPALGSDAGKSSNNLKQLILAWHNYHDTHLRFPFFPRDPRHIGEDGKPYLSWRVHILPYLEEETLFDQFKLDEPWDSEHNLPLAAKMPAIYLSPGTDPRLAAEGKTRYQIPVGPDMPGGISGRRLSISDITDGTSNTIAIVEAPESAAVVWTKPDDLEITPATITALLDSRQEGLPVAFYDGTGRVLSKMTDPQNLKAMFTHAGGERIE